MASFCLESLWTGVQSEFSRIEDDFKAAFLYGQHMWEAFYPLKRLEEWDTLKPNDSDPHCLCTAATHTPTYTHTHAHTRTHAEIERLLYLLSGSGMKVKVAFATEELCVFAWCVSAPRCKRSLCLAYRRLKDTWALIIFAVSPPRHVA